MFKNVVRPCALAVFFFFFAHAGQAEVSAQLKLLDLMVQEGVISADKAQNIRTRMTAGEQVNLPAPEAGSTRVNYVPETVKNQIRDEVRNGMREDVVKDVMTQAKNERWGVPGALPEWANRIKFKGDLRMRAESDVFASDNIEYSYLNYNKINEKKKFDLRANELYENANQTYLDVTDDRYRLRTRARVSIDAKITELTKASIRLATGSSKNPVSTNQTLGNEGLPWDVFVDRAYVSFTDLDMDRYPWVTATVGRMNNPFVTTDLLWDGDLAFEGAAATFKYDWKKSGLFAIDDHSRTLFATVGIFAVDESEITSQDKWLYALQLGGDFTDESQNKFTVAVGYYDYENMVGVLNQEGSNTQDFTAPNFFQKGNTVFNIVNYISAYDLDPSKNTPPTDALAALAAEYKIVDLNLNYDIAAFSPYHIILTTHVLKNIGYSKKDVQARLDSQDISFPQPATSLASDPVVPYEYADSKPKTKGYYVNVDFGWPLIAKRGDWSVGVGYKYLQADAVVDAYTDSDFHLGGTDAKGFILSGRYGITDDTFVQLRYMSASEIDAVNPLSVDVAQLDLNVKF